MVGTDGADTGGVTGAGDGTGAGSGPGVGTGGVSGVDAGTGVGSGLGADPEEGKGTAAGGGAEAGDWSEGAGVGAGATTGLAQPVISERKSTNITSLALSISLPSFSWDSCSQLYYSSPRLTEQGNIGFGIKLHKPSES